MIKPSCHDYVDVTNRGGRNGFMTESQGSLPAAATATGLKKYGLVIHSSQSASYWESGNGTRSRAIFRFCDRFLYHVTFVKKHGEMKSVESVLRLKH